MRARFFLFMGVTGLLVACGSGGGGDSGGSSSPPVSSGGTVLSLEPNFNSIQTKLFNTTCAVSGCHTGAGAPHGLDLSAGNSYALLVNVDSAEVPALKRIKPLEPGNSYLIQKLEGTAAVGARMPRGGAALAASDIAAIRQWITDGALADGGGLSDAKSLSFAVQAVVPAEAAVLTAPISQLVVIFTQPLDASGVYPESFTLERSGGDQQFAEANEIVIRLDRVEVPAGNPQTVVLKVNADAMIPDTYRLVVHATGNIPVQDLAAHRLPGDYVSRFKVRQP